MRLSPDGKYLALVVPQSEHESRLLVLEAASLKAVGGLNSSPMHQVGDFWSVSAADQFQVEPGQGSARALTPLRRNHDRR